MQAYQSTAVAVVIGILVAVPIASHAQPAFGVPELVAAARSSDHQAVRNLLEAGADPDAAYGGGTTALHWAAHRDAAAMVTDRLAG
ncbi:MAG: ankyrin repeat domain-containing protein, partial [Acidobacteria bacterium]|nr:ankyrin repeat domain-containing protein [Acidobacteriota bacterium]